MTLTVEIKDSLQKPLERMATENGKPVGQFVVDIIDDFVGRSFADHRESQAFMKLSETSFSEWDNEEDAIYDSL